MNHNTGKPPWFSATVTTKYSGLQHIAKHCKTLHLIAMNQVTCLGITVKGILTEAQCNTLQHTAQLQLHYTATNHVES